MKDSIYFLPQSKQDDLHYLVKMVRERLPQAEMIILYGSYARNEYVEYDQRVEFGIPTIFMSDYDILVVTHGIPDKEAGKKLDNIDDIYYKYPDKQTPVQFINEDIKKLNQDLSEGRYFYTQVKQDGILLYNSGKFELAEHRQLCYDEIKQQAEEYFEEKFKQANSFLRSATHAYDDADYKIAAFLLHQAAENFYYAIRLVYTLKNNKQHNLTKLSSSVRTYSHELRNVFPRHTEEEKRLFNLLKLSYVEARYNPKFVVTQEDIRQLTQKVEHLRDITQQICQQKIAEYGKMIE